MTHTEKGFEEKEMQRSTRFKLQTQWNIQDWLFWGESVLVADSDKAEKFKNRMLFARSKHGLVTEEIENATFVRKHDHPLTAWR